MEGCRTGFLSVSNDFHMASKCSELLGFSSPGGQMNIGYLFWVSAMSGKRWIGLGHPPLM